MRKSSLWREQCGWVEEYATKWNEYVKLSILFKQSSSSVIKTQRSLARLRFSVPKLGFVKL